MPLTQPSPPKPTPPKDQHDAPLCPQYGVIVSGGHGASSAVKEVKLELEFKRYETCEDKIREIYRPKGLLAYATAAGEYVRVL